ncbi:MAG: hypothetical protein M3Q71_24340 [Chloroflexota bacterium]|nr:hypothetical protein [Chloroflexota bacterium]MDP9473752.1 hypothetical protein [Chloroflexota bacterium]
MRRFLIAGALVGALTVTGGSAALAAHDHYLVTPGTCVEDIASGQTSQTSGGGGHQFHDNVHLGTPGMEAFANPDNPVSVYKAGTGPGC